MRRLYDLEGNYIIIEQFHSVGNGKYDFSIHAIQCGEFLYTGDEIKKKAITNLNCILSLFEVPADNPLCFMLNNTEWNLSEKEAKKYSYRLKKAITKDYWFRNELWKQLNDDFEN